MVGSSNITKSNTKPTIVRQDHLAEKIVFVDGLAGCGKTMLSPIVSSMDRVELNTYAFEIEFICRLFRLGKIEEDAAISMVKMLTDHKLYQTMMGREINFRYSDLSSVFKDSRPWRYFKRIFQKGDIVIPKRIEKEKPILNLTTHNLLSMAEPIILGLENRVVFIEVVRHPLYMIIQQTLNMERLLNNPRDIQIYIKYGQDQLPYFAYKWEKRFVESNEVEKAIFTTEKFVELTEDFKIKHQKFFGDKILTIPFESFVLNPFPFMNKLENLLETTTTSKTHKIMKKQKVPRKKISDGIPLAIYKRCGWELPEKDFTEKQELEKRRQFAIDNGANIDALDILDKLSQNYEDKYFNFQGI